MWEGEALRTRTWSQAIFPLRYHRNPVVLGMLLGTVVSLSVLLVKGEHFQAAALIESKSELSSTLVQKIIEQLSEADIESPSANLFRVGAKSSTPQKAVKQANLLAERFITVARREQSLDREIQRKKLESEIKSVEDKLSLVGKELEESPLNQGNQELVEGLKKSLAEVGSKKARLAGILATEDSLEPKEIKQQLLQLRSKKYSLSQTLGPKHPEMLKLDAQIEETTTHLRSESIRMVSELNRDLREAEIAERELKQSLDEQLKLASLNSATADRSIKEQEYHLLTERHKVLKDELLRVKPLAEIMLSSLASGRTSSYESLFLSPLLFGLLALFFSVTRRKLDTRFFSTREVERRLNIPVLSRVPRIDWLPGASIVSAHQSEAWEAYRTLRTALLLNAEGEIPRVIQFTSVESGEGKTLTSCNVAVALAAAGKRTVLVDADLRNGQVVEVLGLQSRSFGLSDLLSGRGSINGLLCSTQFPNLEVIQRGSFVSDPSALLLSSRMNELLSELKRSVDYVIVDSPALLPSSDSLVISASVDGVSLVMKEGGPSGELVDEALLKLQRVGARVLGVTINEGAVKTRREPVRLIETAPKRLEQLLSEQGPGFNRLTKPGAATTLRVLDRGEGESLVSLLALEQKLWQERVENPELGTDVLIFAELVPGFSVGGFSETRVVDDVVQMNRGGGVIEHGSGQLTAFLVRSLGCDEPAEYLKSFQRILVGTVSRLGLEPESARKFVKIGLTIKSKVSLHGAFIDLCGPKEGMDTIAGHYHPSFSDLKESLILSLMSEFDYSGVSVLSSVSGNNLRELELQVVGGRH